MWGTGDVKTGNGEYIQSIPMFIKTVEQLFAPC